MTTITLNNRNTTGTWTAEFDRFEYARTLTPKQRAIVFTLGAQMGNDIATRVGYQPDANRTCAYAAWCAEVTHWTSLKAAKAAYVTAQKDGYFLI